MPSVFFKIGTTDLTPWVDVQSYAVNREDVYEEWEDANWILHRVIARTRYSGSFQLGFSRADEFAAFTALLEAQRDPSGYYAVTAYINNTGETVAFIAFLDVLNEEDKWDRVNGRQWLVVTVTLTER